MIIVNPNSLKHEGRRFYLLLASISIVVGLMLFEWIAQHQSLYSSFFPFSLYSLNSVTSSDSNRSQRLAAVKDSLVRSRRGEWAVLQGESRDTTLVNSH